jgi:hypothetical protein
MGEWVRLAAVHPETRQIFTFDARAGFQPYTPSNPILPSVSRSRDWYSGHADFLQPRTSRPSDRGGSPCLSSIRPISSSR